MNASFIRSVPRAVRQAIARHRVLQWPLWLRARAGLRRGPGYPGATVVIVNWNSEKYLDVCLRAIRQFTAPGAVDVVVMDNASSDASADVAKRYGARFVRLPRNLGHEVAMDLGIMLARREYVIAMDVDAFPLSREWLDRLLGPLQRNEADVAGAHVRGGFVHPCCLAIRRERFIRRRHTFMPQRAGEWATSADEPHPVAWDTGWAISLREPRRHLLERTFVHGPGEIGSAWEPVVYHNFYATRFNATIKPGQAELDGGVSERSAEQAWDWAVGKFLNDG